MPPMAMAQQAIADERPDRVFRAPRWSLL